MTSTRGPALVPIMTLLLLLFDCGTSYVPATRTARFNPPHPTHVERIILTNGYYLHQENGSTALSLFGRSLSLSNGRSHGGCPTSAKRRTGSALTPTTVAATSAAAKESRLMGSPTSADTNDHDGASDETTTGEQTEQTEQRPNEPPAAETELDKDLTEDDWAILSTIVRQSKMTDGDGSGTGDDPSDATERILIATLPQMPPRLTLKLRRAADGIFGDDDGTTEERRAQLETVGKVLVRVLDDGLKSGKETLSTLLDAGEVRKLDGEIGRALREGRLDMAFFTVLNMNLGAAAEEEKEEKAAAEDAGVEVKTGNAAVVTTRYQILQHIYTRCQEEVEKSVDPGAGLLNKLLRTDVDSIRLNQLKHYLVPEVNTITAADGSEIKLEGAKALVPPEDLLKALADAVKQIRTVEKAGGTNRETAAGLVESCRQLAIEARLVIGEGYGADDETTINFQDGLQPVFRPSSAESEYIQGST